MDKFKKAKEIYCKYGGKFFSMDREGDWGKYKAFCVPSNVEKKWREEIKNKQRMIIKNEQNVNKFQFFCKGLIEMSADTIHSEDVDITGLLFVYELFVEKRENLDTVTNMRLIRQIFKWVEQFSRVDKSTTLKIMNETLYFLSKLIKKPITVSADYYNTYGAMFEDFSDEKLIKRMNSRIKEYSNLYEKIKNEDKVLLLK